MDKDLLRKLEERLGPIHARQRLGIETDHEAQVFGQGLTFFHLENSRAAPAIIRNALKLTGLYWRARRNAGRIIVKRNDLRFAALPSRFDGYTILHISDMHVDMSEAAMQHLIELVGGMQYDLCVLTGDYRGKTFGPFEAEAASPAWSPLLPSDFTQSVRCSPAVSGIRRNRPDHYCARSDPFWLTRRMS